MCQLQMDHQALPTKSLHRLCRALEAGSQAFTGQTKRSLSKDLFYISQFKSICWNFMCRNSTHPVWFVQRISNQTSNSVSVLVIVGKTWPGSERWSGGSIQLTLMNLCCLILEPLKLPKAFSKDLRARPTAAMTKFGLTEGKKQIYLKKTS